MDRFQFDINGGKNEFHIYENQKEAKREQEITEVLEVVKNCYKDNVVKRSYEDNKKYSSSVEYYLRLKEKYHEVILKEVAKAKGYRLLDPEKWECKLVTTDSLGETRKKIFDCELCIDILLYYSHPDFSKDNENEPYVTIQFKVITCYREWNEFRPKLSYDLQRHGSEKRIPCEAYGLRNIDFYVWFYWCKVSDTWRKMYIMKDPKILTPYIMQLKGNNPVPNFGEMKVEKAGEHSTKRTIHLNPNNQLFRNNLILERDNPDLDCGLLQ